VTDPTKPSPRAEINHRFAGRVLATGKVAASALRLASRRALSADDGSVYAVIGENIARELDGMKGMAMKVGQILSYLDGTLPPETHAALRVLQKGATPVAFSSLVPVVEAALGAPIGRLFEWIDEEPIAAASIGQVHRARFAGADVAVKIQYPDVRATFESDLGRLEHLAGLASLATAVDGKALVAELRARILEECDYLREASSQRAFAARLAVDPDVVIPDVFLERTRATVLTTRFAPGMDFQRFAETSDAARRNAVARTLVRVSHRSFFALGALNADPHPGNYVFPPEGPVVLLDFGCVRRFEPGYVERERHLARVVCDDDRARFRDALLATGIVSRPDRFDFGRHWELMRHQYQPYIEPRFRFTRAYLQRLVDFGRPGEPNLRLLAIAPEWIWQQRLVSGLHAILTRLDAEGPFRDAFRAALDEPLDPLQAA
jgi:predicted unusual protein kinase regulating ubiquinone biosynthesis (AarF/ABC1/UbiB family)